MSSGRGSKELLFSEPGEESNGLVLDGVWMGVKVGSLVKPNLHQSPLAWDPEMDEAAKRPPYMLMIDDYFTVYQRRRRRLVSGEAPEGVNGDRPMHAREWQACQNRMNEEPAWERAERYRRMMQENGYRSIRALARAIGEDHSRIARVLKVLDLPGGVLAALWDHSQDVRVRAHFTDTNLSSYVEY